MKVLQIHDFVAPGNSRTGLDMCRHLIARGYKPGAWFGQVLSACRDVQDETGWDDPERILDRVLTSDGPQTKARQGLPEEET